MKRDYTLTDSESDFVDKNHNLIYGFATKYGVNVNEYYGELALALIKAIKTFNKSKGKLSNYAYKIMMNEIRMAKRQERNSGITGTKIVSLDEPMYIMNGEEIYYRDIISDKESSEDMVDNISLIEERIKYISVRDIKMLALKMNGCIQTDIGKEFGISQAQVGRRIQKIKDIITSTDLDITRSMEENARRFEGDSEYRKEFEDAFYSIQDIIDSYLRTNKRIRNSRKTTTQSNIKSSNTTKNTVNGSDTSKINIETKKIIEEQSHKHTETSEDKQTSIIYSDDFDPITFRHLDIIKRASKLFDKVIVAIDGSNNHTFTQVERVRMAEIACKNIPNVTVGSYNNSLHKYMDSKKINTVLKSIGIYNSFDTELKLVLEEMSMMDIETIFIPSSIKYMHLSSSYIKGMAYNGENISKGVPEEIIPMIKIKFNRVQTN